ncbi:hypothetical protein OSTOST_12588, partial [Ostertagia ostertagi]
SWISGVLYNFTTHFVRGAVGAPSSVFTDLVDYIIKKNNYEVGQSKLYISPDQMNPFTACYSSDCHANAICTPLGKGIQLLMPNGYGDLNPSHPGRQCLAYVGVNECEKPELNECSPDARCIDLDYLYKCECVSPYVNAAPEGAVPGSVCTIDYCSDVHYCPLNSTCKNVGDQAGLGDAICMRHTDVNECLLGLHNCSAGSDLYRPEDEMMGHDNAAVLGAYLDDGASVSSDGSLEEIELKSKESNTKHYDSESDADSDAGRATYDRVTRVAQSHDFLPGADPRVGTERRRNEVVTTTTAEEVNYF